jgi:hypothetical protein
MKPLTISIFLFLMPALASAQSGPWASDGNPAGAVPVRMIVTAEPLGGDAAPSVSLKDVSVVENWTSAQVTEWLPFRSDNAGLELYILIDERVNPAQSAVFEELRRFVASQGPKTAVGIAYMDNGEARIAQRPTKDHARASNALRAPTGNESAGASPYASLSELINGWTPAAEERLAPVLRREVVLVSDGIDRFENVGSFNMYVEEAIADAEQAGVLVYCLYAPAAGHASHSPALIHWGQTYLAQLAEETGGEAYFSGRETSASFEPYLSDITEHLSHQYLATFLAVPAPASGFRPVKFESKLPDVELISAYRFHLERVP